MTVPAVFDGAPILLLGRQERYSLTDLHQHIPVHWAWFGPRIVEIGGRLGDDTFGLCSDSTDEAMSYFCGVRIPVIVPTPPDLVTIAVPALRYTVFPHTGPVDSLSQTIVAAFGKALPAAGFAPYRAAGVPDLLERYGPDFNPQTGLGTIEIWIPVGPL